MKRRPMSHSASLGLEDEYLSNSAPAAVSRPILRRTAIVAFIGASIDSYDFFIYGTASALVFAKVFFPETSPATGILLSFASFGAGFAARPLGGILFGHLGDRRGRKFALVTCLLGMALCTTLMGLLPTYASIGAWAGVLLVALRLVQGVFFGGEAGGALMLLGEVAPGSRRGLYGGIALAGAPGGIIVANGVFFIVVATTSDSALLSWAWRVPFLASVVLIAISIYANVKLEESPAFEAHQQIAASSGANAVTETRSPIVRAISTHWLKILLGAGCYASLNVGFYVISAFAVHYATSKLVGMSSDQVLGALLIASLVMLIFSIYAGHLSDRVGREPLLIIGSGGFIVWSFIMWPLISTGNFWFVLAAFVIGLGILLGFASGVYGALVLELFPTSVRFSGVSLSVQLCAVLAGGFSPLIAAAIFNASGSTAGVAAFVAAWCAITVICASVVLIQRKRRGGDSSTNYPAGDHS